MLMWNFFLAIVWMACWGDASFPQFLAGFLVGFVVLIAVESLLPAGRVSYTSKALKALELIGFFFAELWKSNIRVAIDLLRPKPKITPAIVAVPLRLKEDWSLTLLANLITLTPGTLSLDLSADKKTLFIHTMYLDGGDKDAFVLDIQRGFEDRILALEGRNDESQRLSQKEAR